MKIIFMKRLKKSFATVYNETVENLKSSMLISYKLIIIQPQCVNVWWTVLVTRTNVLLILVSQDICLLKSKFLHHHWSLGEDPPL